MNKHDILLALEKGGLQPVTARDGTIYVYIDGPGMGPVASEWLLSFQFKANELTHFAIEKGLVGP